MSKKCPHRKEVSKTKNGKIICNVKGRKVDVKDGRCQADDCSLK